MKSRTELQTKLEQILGNDNVYFQPPTSVSLHYPCIVYELARTNVNKADNKRYISFNEYKITHMFKSLKHEKKDQLLDNFTSITHYDRENADGIYHDYFTLYW